MFVLRPLHRYTIQTSGPSPSRSPSPDTPCIIYDRHGVFGITVGGTSTGGTRGELRGPADQARAAPWNRRSAGHATVAGGLAFWRGVKVVRSAGPDVGVQNGSGGGVLKSFCASSFVRC